MTSEDPPAPCLRSHTSVPTEPRCGSLLDVGGADAAGDGSSATTGGEMARLIKQMPKLHFNAKGRVFSLIAPGDVDVASACLDPSWFFNIVVTIMDRNGTVVYYETYFPENPSLGNGVANLLDVRWGDLVNKPDAEIWNQHLIDAFVEADRWRSACLQVSNSPPPLENVCSGGGGRSSIANSEKRHREDSGSSVHSQQQQVVSTTSRLSPNAADAYADSLQRHFITSPLYRARWGSAGGHYYFRTTSLPFLRHQGCGGGGCPGPGSTEVVPGFANTVVTMATAPHEVTNVFSPTSSFENLLLLNYHGILGRIPEGGLSGAPPSQETALINASALCVVERPPSPSRTLGSPSGNRTIAPPLPIGYPPASLPQEHRYRPHFDCAEGAEESFGAAHGTPSSCASRLNPREAAFFNQGDLCRFDHHLHHQASLQLPLQRPPSTTGPHSNNIWGYSSGHLTPVDIDWIDQSQAAAAEAVDADGLFQGTLVSAPLSERPSRLLPHCQPSREQQMMNQRQQPLEMDHVYNPQQQFQRHQPPSQHPHFSGLPSAAAATNRTVTAPTCASSHPPPLTPQLGPSVAYRQRQQPPCHHHPTSAPLHPPNPQSSSYRAPSVGEERRRAISPQNGRITEILSLLRPEAIREIKEAVGGPQETVAQRVRAIVTRHLGPETLSKFVLPLADVRENLFQTPSHPPHHPPAVAPHPSSTDRGYAHEHQFPTDYQLPLIPNQSTTPSLFKESPATTKPIIAPRPYPASSVPKKPSLVLELNVSSAVAAMDDTSSHDFFVTTGNGNDSSHASFSPETKSRPPCCPQQPLAYNSSSQTSGTATPLSFDSAGAFTGPRVTPTTPSRSLIRKHTNSTTEMQSPSSSSSGVLESLLSGEANSTFLWPNCGRHRNASEAMGTEVIGDSKAVVDFRQRSSGPSSASCQVKRGGGSSTSSLVFGFEGAEELPITADAAANPPLIGGFSYCSSPNEKSRNFSGPKNLASPSSTSSSCTSLAHLLVHGVLAPAALPNQSTNSNASSSSSSITTPTTTNTPAPSTAPSTAPATLLVSTTPLSGVDIIIKSPPPPVTMTIPASRVSHPPAVKPKPHPLLPRPGSMESGPGGPRQLDRPLSVIVDSHPPLAPLVNYCPSAADTAVATPTLPKYPTGEAESSSTTPRTPQQQQHQLLLLPCPMKSPSRLQPPAAPPHSGQCPQSSSMRDLQDDGAADDEYTATANSTICRLLVGPDLRWEKFAEEVKREAAGGLGVSRHYQCPDTLLFDSSPAKLPRLEPHSIGRPTGSLMKTEPPSSTATSSANSASPSTANLLDPASGSPATVERNRKAAAAAAAKIALEAETQRNRMPSRQNEAERKRLMRQQLDVQITPTGHAAGQAMGSNCLNCVDVPSADPAEPASSPMLLQPLHLNRETVNNNSSTANFQSCQSIDNFTRRMKEIAPNVRVTHAPIPAAIGQHYRPLLATPPPASSPASLHITPLGSARPSGNHHLPGASNFCCPMNQSPAGPPTLHPRMPLSTLAATTMTTTTVTQFECLHLNFPPSIDQEQQQQQRHLQPIQVKQQQQQQCRQVHRESCYLNQQQAWSTCSCTSYLQTKTLYEEVPVETPKILGLRGNLATRLGGGGGRMQASTFLPSSPAPVSMMPSSTQVKSYLREKVESRRQARICPLLLLPASSNFEDQQQIRPTVPMVPTVSTATTTTAGQKRPFQSQPASLIDSPAMDSPPALRHHHHHHVDHPHMLQPLPGYTQTPSLHNQQLRNHLDLRGYSQNSQVHQAYGVPNHQCQVRFMDYPSCNTLKARGGRGDFRDPRGKEEEQEEQGEEKHLMPRLQEVSAQFFEQPSVEIPARCQQGFLIEPQPGSGEHRRPEDFSFEGVFTETEAEEEKTSSVTGQPKDVELTDDLVEDVLGCKPIGYFAGQLLSRFSTLF